MSACDRAAYGFGVFLIICAVIIGCTWPHFTHKKLALTPTSETYKLWMRTPSPMYMEVYLFNLKNPKSFTGNDYSYGPRTQDKPEFEEIGPFVFEEVHHKIDVSWNGASVSYNQTRYWSFVPDESVDLSVPITNLNVILVTIARMARDNITLLDFVRTIFSRHNTIEALTVTRPAKEWMFDGINSKILEQENSNEEEINFPYEKFGWFYGRNLSPIYDGRFNINTGEDDIFNLGALQQWNHVSRTRFYDGQCAEVKGSTGELFSPMREQQNNITIFVTDICGPLTLQYSGEKSVEGLNGYSYVGDKSIFDNGKSHPGTECFCIKECHPSGVRDITSCRDAPFFVSFPHFYLADRTYTKAVGGMKPNQCQHEFKLTIDPFSGLPLEVQAQLQLNVLLQPLPNFPHMGDVPRVFVPMMWFRQRAKVTPELASRLKSLQLFEKNGIWVACGLGLLGVLIIVVRFCVVKYCTRSKPVEPPNPWSAFKFGSK